MTSTDDQRISKLPRWAQILIGQQQATIARYESLERVAVPEPWLYSRGVDQTWSPLAGRTDLQVRYGADPDTDPGHHGINLRRGDHWSSLEVFGANSALIVRPIAANHIEIRLEVDPGEMV